tara:strand:- start:512 stop:1825 length:1314 start_codon:yes stop_codon:yes gene_type:complete
MDDKKEGEAGKSIRSNVMANGILQFLNYAFPIITLPFVGRIIGTQEFGVINFYSVLVGYFTLFVIYGFDASATRRVPELVKRTSDLKVFFVEIQSSKILLLLIAASVYSILLVLIPDGNEHYKVAWSTFAVAAGWALMPNWFVQGIRRMKELVWLNIIPKTFFLVLIFLLIRSVNDSYLYPLFISLSTILSAFLSLLYLRLRLKMPLKIHFNRSMFHRLWSERLVFLSSLINNLNQTVSIIILASFVSYSQVGIFSLGWRMMNVIQVLVSVPILQALFPVLGVQLRSNIQEGTKSLNQSIPLLLIIVTIASSSLWLICPWLIDFFFGPEFIDAAGVYQLIAFLPLISVLNHLIGSSFLLNLGYDNDVLRVTIVASVTAIALNLFLISSYGLKGAIVALILTEIILLILYSGMCKNRGLKFWNINEWKLSLVLDHLKR